MRRSPIGIDEATRYRNLYTSPAYPQATSEAVPIGVRNLARQPDILWRPRVNEVPLRRAKITNP